MCAALFYGSGLECERLRVVVPQSERRPPDEDAPMTLEEAAGLVVRHFDTFGTVGMDAAIRVLRGALER